jgi:hypothetical protein
MITDQEFVDDALDGGALSLAPMSETVQSALLADDVV